MASNITFLMGEVALPTLLFPSFPTFTWLGSCLETNKHLNYDLHNTTRTRNTQLALAYRAISVTGLPHPTTKGERGRERNCISNCIYIVPCIGKYASAIRSTFQSFHSLFQIHSSFIYSVKLPYKRRKRDRWEQQNRESKEERAKNQGGELLQTLLNKRIILFACVFKVQASSSKQSQCNSHRKNVTLVSTK